MDGISKMKSILADYYKKERQRSETCLGDILTIITDSDTGTEGEQIEAILKRMVAHYERVDA